MNRNQVRMFGLLLAVLPSIGAASSAENRERILSMLAGAIPKPLMIEPEMTLKDCLEQYKKLVGIELAVDFSDLRAAGVNEETTVGMIHLKKASCRAALASILAQVSDPTAADKAISFAVGPSGVHVGRVTTLQLMGLEPAWPLFRARDLTNAGPDDPIVKLLAHRAIMSDFKGHRFGDVISFLRDILDGSTDLIVFWDLIERAGISFDAKIFVVTKNKDLRTVLSQVLASASTPKARLEFSVEDSGLIVVAPASDMKKLVGFPAPVRTTSPGASGPFADSQEAARLLRMADLYLRNGLREKAQEKYREIIAKWPKTPEAREADDKLKSSTQER